MMLALLVMHRAGEVVVLGMANTEGTLTSYTRVVYTSVYSKPVYDLEIRIHVYTTRVYEKRRNEGPYTPVYRCSIHVYMGRDHNLDTLTKHD